MPGVRGLRRVTHQGRAVHGLNAANVGPRKRPDERPSRTLKVSGARSEGAAMGEDRTCRDEPERAKGLERRENRGGGGG